MLSKFKDAFGSEKSSTEKGGSPADECVAGMLETYADTALDLPKVPKLAVQARSGKWKEHVLTAADFPERNGPPLEKNSRDYGTLQKWFRQIRELETKSISTELNDLRGLLSGLFERFTDLSKNDDKDVQTLSSEMKKLKDSLQAKTFEELKNVVSGFVRQFESMIHSKNNFKAEMMRQMDEEIKTLKTQISQLKFEMSRDGLTQLFNRRSLDKHMQDVVENCRKSGRNQVTLFMLDIDHFKKVNDTYGHQVGDTALKSVAEACLKACNRKQDFVARYGGEEMCVVAEGLDRDGSRALATKILESLRALEIPFAKGTFRLTATIGLAFLEKNESLENWLKRADESLYLGKSLGRNRMVEAAGSNSSGRVA